VKARKRDREEEHCLSYHPHRRPRARPRRKAEDDDENDKASFSLILAALSGMKTSQKKPQTRTQHGSALHHSVLSTLIDYSRVMNSSKLSSTLDSAVQAAASVGAAPAASDGASAAAIAGSFSTASSCFW